MGWLTRLIEAGRGHLNPLSTIEQGVFLDLGDSAAKRTKFWVQLVLASFIAAGGVVGNSTPAVIGAMIIAPLGTPIYGLALAAVTGNGRALRNSLGLLAAGIGVNVLVGVLVGLITFDRMPLGLNPQVAGRTAPTLLDLEVAIAVGLAGSFALSRRDVSDILSGVAIAISLVPVLAVVGITLAAGRWLLALGALTLFLTNAVAILVAGVLVFTASGYRAEAERYDPRAGRRAVTLIAALLALLLVGLFFSSSRALRFERWTEHVQSSTYAWLEGTPWRLAGVQARGQEIFVTIIGQGATPDPEELGRLIRRRVPADVPVILVEQSGSEREL